MINRILVSITETLNEFLGSYYDIPEGGAEVGTIGGDGGENYMNKVIVSLLNIERETAMGISKICRSGTGSTMTQGDPAWNLNLYFVVAAVFDDKRYAESLKMLSASIGFLQQNSVFPMEGKQSYTIEPVTLSLQELTNVWSIMGGHYYPSVVCKLRMVTFDSADIRRTVNRVKGVNM